MTEYSSAPQSITEIRADREGDMRIWTPRDVLVSTLRALDAGDIAPDALVVIYRTKLEDDETETRHAKACPDIHTALGLCHRAAHTIQKQWDNG